LAWIGGTVGAGAAAAAAGSHKHSNGKYRLIYMLSFVVALILFVVIFSQV